MSINFKMLQTLAHNIFVNKQKFLKNVFLRMNHPFSTKLILKTKNGMLLLRKRIPSFAFADSA